MYKINGNMLKLSCVLIIASAGLILAGKVQWGDVGFIWLAILAFYFGNQRGIVKADTLERNPALLKTLDSSARNPKDNPRYGERIC